MENEWLMDAVSIGSSFLGPAAPIVSGVVGMAARRNAMKKQRREQYFNQNKERETINFNESLAASRERDNLEEQGQAFMMNQY